MALPRIESITNRCIQQGWGLSNDAQGENSRNGTLCTPSVNPPRKQRMSLRPRSVTYGKSFLRAFTRQKRYLTCVNFPFLSSPRDGSRTVSRIVHSPEFSEFIQRGDGTESKLMSLVGNHWEIVATKRLKSIIRGKRTFAMIPQQRSAARRLPHAGVSSEIICEYEAVAVN